VATLDPDVPLSYAVFLFFLNGGARALVVRNSDPADTTATAAISGDITLNASSPGKWAEIMTATVDTKNLFDPANQFNLTINVKGEAAEFYTGLTLGNVAAQLAASRLVTLDPTTTYKTLPKPGDTAFKAPAAPAPAAPPPAAPADAGGAGNAPAPAAAAAAATPLPLGDQQAKTGIYALAKADIFNMLCLPVKPDAPLDPTTILAPAVEFCKERRAVLIVDPPAAWANITSANAFETVNGNPALQASEELRGYAAVYFPNLVIPGGRQVTPCGAVAGVWAATDSARGVWKAPAGTAAGITGIKDLAAHVDDTESGILNPIAVNALRTMPAVGPVVWGARTMAGSDQQPDQWKYIPVRRTALYIEESLRRGTQWVVFEPNDEPLWSSIRLNVTAFMNRLFREGAFQGATPAEAYVVKCDKDNNPQDQIDLGIVNILVGFAPLKPAEFVIINIQQQAGQA
jgi:hypothetical protein